MQFVMVVSGASFHQVNEPSYFDIVARSKCQYPEGFFASIDKDVHRTRVRSAQEAESLRKVLCAYAVRNPGLLYCQGLNVIASNLLVSGFSEEEAFWLLTCLIEQVLPFDCFVNLRPVVCLNSIFNDLCRVLAPGFLEFCDKVLLQTSFFFVTWVVTLFGKGFENELFTHFLAIIVLEKDIGVVKIALTIIRLAYPGLEAVEDFGAALKFLEDRQLKIGVAEFAKEYAKLYVNPVLFRALFDQYLTDYPREECKSLTRNFNLKRRTLPCCNTEYEICLHVVEIEKELRGLRETQVLKVKAPLEDLVDGEYFGSSHANRRKTRSFLKPEFLEQIKVGRHTHICTQEIRSHARATTFVCEDDIEEDFENLNEGETRTRDLSPPASALYDDMSGQFDVVEVEVSEEFELAEDAEEQLRE